MKARTVAAVVAFGALTVAPRGPSRAAMDEAEKLRRGATVATVGGKPILAGTLEDRLAEVPRFQLLTFGVGADAVRRRFLDEVVVREALLERAAADKSAASDPALAHAKNRVLSNATLRAVRRGAGTPTPDEIKAYYDANRSRYETPERIQVWRILCATRDEALSVLDAAKKDGTPAIFQKLAREKSLDKASNLRGGNLGFLTADGASNEAGLKVDPAIVKAAQGVRDGELVPLPVAEDKYFAVVWRRGTVSASKRSVDEVKDLISDTLQKQKVEEGTRTLIARLREKELTEFHPELVAAIELPPVDPARAHASSAAASTAATK